MYRQRVSKMFLRKICVISHDDDIEAILRGQTYMYSGLYFGPNAATCSVDGSHEYVGRSRTVDSRMNLCRLVAVQAAVFLVDWMTGHASLHPSVRRDGKVSDRRYDSNVVVVSGC